MSQQYPQQQPPSQQPRPSKTNWKVINIVAGSAAAVVILIGAITGNLSSDDTSSKDRAASTKTTAPPSEPPAVPEPEPVVTPEPTVPPKPVKTTPAPKPKPVVYKKLTAREWAKIAKSPDDYAGDTILVHGVVTQFDAATGEDGFLADADARRHADEYDYTENTAFQQEVGAGLLDDLVEGDFFTAKVKVTGSYSYDTQIGGNTTVPALEVISITVTGSSS